MNVDCYRQIIGLTRCQCDCEDPLPPEASASLSGLFLDEMEGLGNLKDIGGCCPGDMWDVLEAARDEAIRIFIAETNTLLLRRARLRRQPYRGDIGRARGGYFTPSGLYAGFRVWTPNIRGGHLRVRKIGGLFSAAGPVTVTVFDGNGAQMATDTIAALAGVHSTKTVDWALPLWNNSGCPETQYFFVYEVAPGQMPAKNDLLCEGCTGFGERFNCQNPYCGAHRTYRGAAAWASWLMVGGWTGDTLDAFDQCPSTAENTLNGLTINVALECDANTAICLDEINFADPHAMGAALAIRYKAAEILAGKLLGSTEPTREHMVNREFLAEHRGKWARMYAAQVAEIAAGAPLENADCLSCASFLNMRVATVRT